MKKFVKLFQKAGGAAVLRQYLHSRVLLFALVQTLLNGFSQKSLEIVRLSVYNRIYKRLNRKYRSFIAEYAKANPAKDCVQKHNPTIWTCWFQGMDQAPEIVKKCYASMCEHITDRPIIVLTDENIRDYITLPDYIVEKYEKGHISKAHFSDLLRIELLYQHGGTWLDSTVFCTEAPFQPYVLDSELFLFQTLKPGLDGHSCNISNWLMTAYAGNPIIGLVRALLHEYWRTHNFAVDYFFFHDFFTMAIEAYPEVWRKVVPFSNSTPHILLLRLFETYDDVVWSGIKAQTSFHKLSYKFDNSKLSLANTYYSHIVGSQQ